MQETIKSPLPASLLSQVHHLAERVRLPAIRSFTVSPHAAPGARRNNFAYLRLMDGSVGLTYVALDGAWQDLPARLQNLPLSGMSPASLAERYVGSQGWERALGLAAVNAISQHLLARNGPLEPMPDNLELLAPRAAERVGMVGYFGRLIDPLRAGGVDLTVIELDDRLLQAEPGLEVTLDASRLEGCAQVIITGTTLLNHTLDSLLAHCSQARDVYLLGPSASCLPDVLFAAGITAVGGFRVTSPDLFDQRWAARGRWRDAGMRYLLTRANYPGMTALLDLPDA
jgi:hypothetical protein